MIQLLLYEPHKSARATRLTSPSMATEMEILMQPHSTRIPSFPANLEDYAPWVATHGLLAPYGECQCGCGQVAPLSTFTKLDKGRIKGLPVRYLPSHWFNKATMADALWEFLTPGNRDECWEWQKKLNGWRYGMVWFRGETFLAHRISYEIHCGAIPEGLKVLHRCDNPPCCNPKHLFLGTDADNVADKVSKKRHAYGERAHAAKLKEADVVKIRELRKEGLYFTEIAAMYSVGATTINNIVNRVTWKHVS